MNSDLADHISLLAAPIYAALLVRDGHDSDQGPDNIELDRLCDFAIEYATALWQRTLDTPG